MFMYFRLCELAYSSAFLRLRVCVCVCVRVCMKMSVGVGCGDSCVVVEWESCVDCANVRR